MLADHAEHRPTLPFARFLERGEVVADLSYLQVWELACRWATLLVERGIRRGDVVPFVLPNTPDFVGAYFGTLIAGGIPAPAAPFRRISSAEPYLNIIAERLRFVAAKLLIAPSAQAEIAQTEPFAAFSDVSVVTAADLPDAPIPLSPAGSPNELGLLQFTSGTSGRSKAVQLTHAALLHQTRVIMEALQIVDRSVDWCVSWLPLFHDMGIIGFLLTPAVVAGSATFLQTEEFMLRPTFWIKALSDLRATITGAPPSAFAMCARRVKESELADYDLSSVRIALVGAETILPESLQPFVDKFARSGFRKTSLMPTYGLAENGLAVTMPPLNTGPQYDRVDKERLQNEAVAAPATANQPSVRSIASVGEPLAQTEVAIISESGDRLSERQNGEILIKSASLMSGYYKQPLKTKQVLQDGWLRSGDMGYLADGNLYITGRKKEVLIVGGRNYYPDDIEQIAAAVPGVRLKRAVAFSYPNTARATEAVVVVVETALSEPDKRDVLSQSVRKAVVNAGYPLSEVVLLSPRTIRKTLNGKLMRVDCKNRYLAGEFTANETS